MQQSTLPKSPLLIATIQLGLLVSAIYYTFIGGQTAQGIYDHNWRLITLWLTTGVIGGWLLWRLLSSHNMPRTPLDFPLLFLLIAWILATIFSVNPVYSQETLVFFVTYPFFFYIAADLGRWSWFTELVFNAIIGVSGLVWTLALLQLSWWYQDQVTIPRLLQNSHEPFLSLPRLSVLGNPNTMASYVALILPIAIYKMAVVHKGMTRILLGLWIVMLGGVILLTQSRGGVLGLVVAVSFYVLVWIFQKTSIFAAGLAGTKATVSPGSKVRKRIWLSGPVVIGLIGLFTWLLLGFRTLDQAVNVRQQVMAGAFKTLLKHPLFGAGPGTLGEELIRHQKPLDVIWADAHNLFLTVIAETGLVGAVGLLWLGVTGLKIVWSTLRQTDRSQWNMASMACLAALLGFITHNMVDSLFKFPLIMLLVAILGGFWLSPHLSFGPDTSPSVSKFWRYPVIIAAAGVVIANTVIGVRGIENIKAYNQAVQAANQGDWPATLNFLKSSHQLAPTVPFYQRQLGLVAGYLSEQGPAYRQEAISQYKAALKGLDQLAIDHANLGCLLWADGQRAEALQEMTLARDLEPGHLLYHLNLGHYLELEGKHETAWLEYAQVLAAQPDYLQSSYWHQTEQRAEALPEIIQGAIQRLSDDEEVSLSSLIQLHLYRNDWQAAWQVYDEYKNTIDPVRSHLEKGKILLAMERLDEAQLEFEAVIQIDPQASKAYLHLSKIALAQNNEVEAEQFVEAALFLGQNPATLYQGALVAQATGNEMEAIQHYEDAFAQLTVALDLNLSRYATEVARRRPLPVSYLPCLIRIYPTQLLVDITQAEGNLLEKQGNYLRASQVYRRLLSYEPTIDPIAAKLERLCDDHSGICDN